MLWLTVCTLESAVHLLRCLLSHAGLGMELHHTNSWPNCLWRGSGGSDMRQTRHGVAVPAGRVLEGNESATGLGAVLAWFWALLNGIVFFLQVGCLRHVTAIVPCSAFSCLRVSAQVFCTVRRRSSRPTEPASTRTTAVRKGGAATGEVLAAGVLAAAAAAAAAAVQESLAWGICQAARIPHAAPAAAAAGECCCGGQLRCRCGPNGEGSHTNCLYVASKD